VRLVAGISAFKPRVIERVVCLFDDIAAEKFYSNYGEK
jgi:hypothetical protein